MLITRQELDTGLDSNRPINSEQFKVQNGKDLFTVINFKRRSAGIQLCQIFTTAGVTSCTGNVLKDNLRDNTFPSTSYSANFKKVPSVLRDFLTSSTRTWTVTLPDIAIGTGS